MTNSYIGKELGNYRLVEQIGGGAFGNAYRAEHLYLGKRVVAVKVMHTAHLDSEEDRIRFIREARFSAPDFVSMAFKHLTEAPQSPQYIDTVGALPVQEVPLS